MKLEMKLPHNPFGFRYSREKFNINFNFLDNSLRYIHISFFFYSVCSIDFAAALQRLGAQAELILFDGKTHTDLFLQVSAVVMIGLMFS
jgi:hypothetical protein